MRIWSRIKNLRLFGGHAKAQRAQDAAYDEKTALRQGPQLPGTLRDVLDRSARFQPARLDPSVFLSDGKRALRAASTSDCPPGLVSRIRDATCLFEKPPSDPVTSLDRIGWLGPPVADAEKLLAAIEGLERGLLEFPVPASKAAPARDHAMAHDRLARAAHEYLCAAWDILRAEAADRPRAFAENRYPRHVHPPEDVFVQGSMIELRPVTHAQRMGRLEALRREGSADISRMPPWPPVPDDGTHALLRRELSALEARLYPTLRPENQDVLRRGAIRIATERTRPGNIAPFASLRGLPEVPDRANATVRERIEWLLSCEVGPTAARAAMQQGDGVLEAMAQRALLLQAARKKLGGSALSSRPPLDLYRVKNRTEIGLAKELAVQRNQLLDALTLPSTV